MIRPHHLNNKIHIAVLGGNGFIGRHVIYRLSQQKNIRIWSLDKRDHDIFIDTTNFKAILQQVKIDLSAEGSIQAWLTANRPDYVIYCAGYEAPTDGLHVRFSDEAKSILALSRTLDALKNIKVEEDEPEPYFLYLSSASVYGFNRKKISTETDTLLPSNYTGMFKLAAEDLVRRICSKLKFPFSILRPVEVYGRQHFREVNSTEKYGYWRGYINYYVDRIVKDKLPKDRKYIEVLSPDTKVELIHVNYLSKVIVDMIISRREGVYNVSSGKAITMMELANLVKNCYNEEHPCELKRSSKLKLEDLTVNSNKMLELVPYENKYDLEKFLIDYIKVRRAEVAKNMAIEQIINQKYLVDTTAYGAIKSYKERQEKRRKNIEDIKTIAGDQFDKIEYGRFQERARDLLEGKENKLEIDISKIKDKLLENK